MGALGSTVWYRCHSCGMDYSHSRADDIARVKPSGFPETIALYYESGDPVYDIHEACEMSENEYGPEWDYVQTPDFTMSRIDWLHHENSI